MPSRTLARLWVAFENVGHDNAAEDEILRCLCRVQELVFDAHALTDHIVEWTGRVTAVLWAVNAASPVAS